ncbi:MAG: cytochrome c biogenesis protein CcdA [Treponema sp.]|uniref:cytochrome c biogenesis protein CcdA n=1 Tax=Treponema sp. TaxID=166 RepID=UPI003FA2C836
MGSTSLPGLAGAFLAGLLSFLSPCVLPLIPVYLSFISGESLSQIRDGSSGRFRLFLRSLSFVLGFTVVFVVLAILFGTGARFIGSSIPRNIMRGAGIVVILLGLNMLFDFIPFLRTELKAQAPNNAAGASKAFLFGMLFAAGWSPCIGPILSSILLFAAQSGNVARAAFLLGAYSLGLGIPFLLTGLFFDKTEPLLRWFKQHARGVKITAGILIIFFGVLMLTAGLTSITTFFIKIGYMLEDYAQTGTPPFSTIAGIIARWLLFQGA